MHPRRDSVPRSRSREINAFPFEKLRDEQKGKREGKRKKKRMNFYLDNPNSFGSKLEKLELRNAFLFEKYKIRRERSSKNYE